MTLAHIDPAQSLTAAVTIDHGAILRALNINVNDPKAQAMILACEKYGLDPLLKHAVLISGNLYVTRDGLLHIAHRSGLLDGIVIEDEGSNSEEWWAKVTVHVKGVKYGYTYRGRYPRTGQLSKYGPEMAVKVAEVMALRRAFGVTGVPAVEEQWDTGPTLATAQQVAHIDQLLPLVPEAVMPVLKAWKAEQGITMKAGEFTAEMADQVIGKLEEMTTSGEEDEDDLPPAAVGTPDADPTPWKATDEDAWGRWNRRCQAKARGTKDKPGVLDPDEHVRDDQRRDLALQASRMRLVPVGSWSEVTETEAKAIEDGLDLLKNDEAQMTLTGSGWICDRKIEAGGSPTPREPDGAADPPASVTPPPEHVTSGDRDIVDAEVVEDDTLDLLRAAIANAPRWTEAKAVRRAREIAKEMGREKLPTDFDSLPRHAEVLAVLAAELVEAAA
jgi:hypothetical protein